MLTQKQIKQYLPHRENMLLIQQVDISHENNSAKGTYYFSGKEWFFNGYTLKLPVVSPSILCEIMAQTACILFLKDFRQHTPYLVDITDTIFREMVFAQQTFIAHCILSGKKGPFFIVDCAGYINNKLCTKSCMRFIARPTLQSPSFFHQ